MNNFMSGMRREVVKANGIKINTWIGGRGKPLLLLHGYPQTAQMWRKITPTLMKSNFSVICPDMRGYGDSEKPMSGYDKRTMAADMVYLMSELGFKNFALAGHDRGARVSHRLALDWPDRVSTLTLMDIVPTLTVFRGTDSKLAAAYWHFFFFQTPDLPEIMISRNLEQFLSHVFRVWGAHNHFIEEEVFQEYYRTFRIPGTIRATLEDYRAAASVDLKHDEFDSTSKIECPVLAIWGKENKTMSLFDVTETWRQKSNDARGQSISCGHFIPEEAPKELLDVMLPFIEYSNPK